MAIKNIFNKKEEVVAQKSDLPEKEEKVKKSVGKKLPMAWSVLRGPYISEKATTLSEKNKYVFKVSDDANKSRVREAVKEVYGADVIAVNMVKIPKKKKRLGKFHGWKKGFKKAIVEIKSGQKIDIYPS